MVDEGEEEGGLEDGGLGAVLAAPATVPAVDEGEDDELLVNDKGAVSAAPMKIPPAKSVSTLEKLKADFNIKEFFVLASRVIDEGDSESMEMMKNLKKQWKEKLGNEVEVAGHGGLRPVQSRQLTPFPAKISRPARRFIIGEALPTGSTCLEAPNNMIAHGTQSVAETTAPAALSSTAAALTSTAAALTSGIDAPNNMIAHGTQLVAETTAAAALTSTAAALTSTAAALTSGFGAPQTLIVHGASRRPLMAAASTAASSEDEKAQLRSATHIMPTTWTVNSSDGDNGLPVVDRPMALPIPFFAGPKPAENRDPSLPWIPAEKLQKHAAPAPQPAPLFNQSPTADSPATAGAPANPMPELFFGNVPFNPYLASKIEEDKIAAAFHNSSRKKPYFHHLNEFVRSIWPGVRDVKATSNGFFFFQFETVAAMEEVIEGGPWLYLGQPIVLQKWEPGMVLRKLKTHRSSGVDQTSTLADGTLDDRRFEHGGKWNWTTALPRCDYTCMYEVGFRSCHSTKECPLSKPTKSVASIYVRKSMLVTPAAPKLKMKEHVQATPVPENIHPDTEVDRVSKEMPGNGRDKAIWNVRGLNRRDHQVAVRDLVCEFRLHFIALLETRVLQSNVTRIQSGVLSRWRWFVDYAGPGNRIWIAWNDELIDVDILNVGTQFIHCRVLVHELHESIFTTVVYGANDVSTRRELWQELIDLAGTIGNVPWLVGGDFNAVLDMSEVSGASGDIRVATTEFNDCILQTGLLSLPMQGERSLGITAVWTAGAYGRDWIDCLLMMYGWIDGRICTIHASHLVHRITHRWF
ncbi:UNVERIFIED_CONTAM: hypothetical protein Sangu_3092900 [Sesamum angustifolium]|uniref:DUF4283 domain-containing protein n=1 Tax=Sesamum angustifolium TaxID=2727405 RepID=A0AAW2K7Z1_9LAMI